MPRVVSGARGMFSWICTEFSLTTEQTGSRWSLVVSRWRGVRARVSCNLSRRGRGRPGEDASATTPGCQRYTMGASATTRDGSHTFAGATSACDYFVLKALTAMSLGWAPIGIVVTRFWSLLNFEVVGKRVTRTTARSPEPVLQTRT